VSDRQMDRQGGIVFHIYIHPFNGPLSGTTQVSRYQKGKTNLDFTEARDSECSGIRWAICKSAPRSRQITTPARHCSVFLQAGCPSCRPTNSVKALKVIQCSIYTVLQKVYHPTFNEQLLSDTQLGHNTSSCRNCNCNKRNSE